MTFFARTENRSRFSSISLICIILRCNIPMLKTFHLPKKPSSPIATNHLQRRLLLQEDQSHKKGQSPDLCPHHHDRPTSGSENRKERGCVLVAQKPRIGFLAATSNHLALRDCPARSAPEGRIPNHPPLARLAADSGHRTSRQSDEARCAKQLPLICSTANVSAPWR